MKSEQWKSYRTRFLVKAKQLSSSLSFVDHLGRQHCGRKGDYLVESSDGVLSIAPRRIFEDIYVRDVISRRSTCRPRFCLTIPHSTKPSMLDSNKSSANEVAPALAAHLREKFSATRSPPRRDSPYRTGQTPALSPQVASASAPFASAANFPDLSHRRSFASHGA